MSRSMVGARLGSLARLKAGSRSPAEPAASRGVQGGFSLIELVVVMAMVAALAAIAVPMYTQYLQRAARSEARSALLETTIWAQRYRTERGSYAGADTALPAALREVRDGAAQLYTIALAATAETFTATATVVAPGRMADDACASMSVDQTGARTQTGTGATGAMCWGR